MSEFIPPEYDKKVIETQCHQVIDNVFQKYQEDSYMMLRIYNYISIQFPHIIDNIKKEKEQRMIRKEYLTNEQDLFIQSFLMNYSYFFFQKTEKYFFYDKVHYHLYSEDDVLYNILISINKERQLLCWKQNTKQRIMTRIKENNLLYSVPESDTIQFVLDHLHPTLFETKAEAKYFLCIIGDNIFKKMTDVVHFIHNKSKKFIQELNNICQVYIGVNLSNSFKHKYYNHEYEFCRLLKIKEIVKQENVWGPLLSTPSFVLDLICVACHYSIRYTNADNFLLNSSNDASLIYNVFYLKNHTHESLVNVFIYEYLDIKKRGETESQISVYDPSGITNITWIDMQYLWRRFLETKTLPTIMFQHTLETMMKSLLNEYYNESMDCFIGISCKHIPAIKNFIAFWEQTVSVTDDLYLEYEVNEICFLYKKWCEMYGFHNKFMNEKQILDLIHYFYPEIDVDRDKYIYKIKCSLWDKQVDIQAAMDSLTASVENGDFIGDVSSNNRMLLLTDMSVESMLISGTETETGNGSGSESWRERDSENDLLTEEGGGRIINYSIPNVNSLGSINSCVTSDVNLKISVCDAYVFYCKYSVKLHKNHEQIASKTYFEKYLYEISLSYSFIEM